jgi:hypothetical protein
VISTAPGTGLIPAQAAASTVFSATEELWVQDDILHTEIYFEMPFALNTTDGGEAWTTPTDF